MQFLFQNGQIQPRVPKANTNAISQLSPLFVSNHPILTELFRFTGQIVKLLCPKYGFQRPIDKKLFYEDILSPL